MTERALDFRNPREVEAARPRLDLECAISLSNFGGLVGKYAFQEADRVLCQLEEKGSVCRQVHGNGWIAKRKDGAEGYIGKDCAKRHFSADSNFATEASRVRREVQVDDLVRRLDARLTDQGTRERVSTAFASYRALSEEFSSYCQSWPRSLVKRMQEMGRSGDRAVRIQYLYAEKDEKGNVTREWVDDSLGTIAGIDIFQPAVLTPVRERLSTARTALSFAVASREQSAKQLRQWLAEIEAADGSATEIDALRAKAASFNEAANLKLLCWTIRNDDDQISIVHAVVERISGTSVSIATARETRKQWQHGIRARNAGRDFRVV
jgi:hypothetical protein